MFTLINDEYEIETLCPKIEYLISIQINSDIFAICTDNNIVEDNQVVYIYKLTLDKENKTKIYEITNDEYLLIEKYIKKLK